MEKSFLLPVPKKRIRVVKSELAMRTKILRANKMVCIFQIKLRAYCSKNLYRKFCEWIIREPEKFCRSLSKLNFVCANLSCFQRRRSKIVWKGILFLSSISLPWLLNKKTNTFFCYINIYFTFLEFIIKHWQLSQK